MAERRSVAAGSPFRLRRGAARLPKRVVVPSVRWPTNGKVECGAFNGRRRNARHAARRRRRTSASASTTRYRSGRCTAGRGKKVCANRRSRACATRNPTPCRKVFFRYCSSRWRAPGQVTGDRRMVVRERAARRRQEKKARFTDVFFQAHVFRSRSTLRQSPSRRRRRRRPAQASGTCLEKKSCAQVLTPEKTVIRFRPKQRLLRKRVSRINTTARETTQPIVRTHIAADAGLASPGKTQRASFIAPVSPGDAGVFVFVGGRVSHARTPGESASPRVSRRRLPTGPTPAAFLAAGPASGQMCCNQT